MTSFQEFYGYANGKLGASQLGRIPEEKYRMLTQSQAVQLRGNAGGAMFVEEDEQGARLVRWESA